MWIKDLEGNLHNTKRADRIDVVETTEGFQITLMIKHEAYVLAESNDLDEIQSEMSRYHRALNDASWESEEGVLL